MRLAVYAVLWSCFLPVAWSDTVYFKKDGSEINGTVTYMGGGAFSVRARFGREGSTPTFRIPCEAISEVRFNGIVANPQMGIPNWIKTLPLTQNADPRVAATLWKKGSVSNTLKSITVDSITIDRQTLRKSEVRAILLQQ